jgi:hypothetical protein
MIWLRHEALMQGTERICESRQDSSFRLAASKQTREACLQRRLPDWEGGAAGFDD